MKKYIYNFIILHDSLITIIIHSYNSPRARGHLIAKFEHSSGVYHLKEHRLGFQKMKLLSVYVGG